MKFIDLPLFNKYVKAVAAERADKRGLFIKLLVGETIFCSITTQTIYIVGIRTCIFIYKIVNQHTSEHVARINITLNHL